LQGFGVAFALDLEAGESTFDLLEIFSGEFDVGGSEVFFQAVELGGTGDGNDPGLLGEEPGEGDLGAGGFFLVGDFAQGFDDVLVGFAGFGLKARDGVADVVAGEGGFLVDGAGEEAFAEGAEGDEADAELFKGGEDVLLRLAPPEGVLALEGGDGLDGVGAADGGGGGFGHAEVLDFTFLDKLFDGSGGLFDGNFEVDAVLVEEVEGVDLEALEAGLGDLADVLRAAVEGVPFAAVVGVGFEAELGGDDDFSAEGGQGFADELLVDEWAVDLGSVEEGDALLDGGADDLDGFVLFRGGAEAEAEAHAAEADGGDFETVFSQGACLHLIFSPARPGPLSCLQAAQDKFRTGGLMRQAHRNGKD
jgi:hypothetical protein